MELQKRLASQVLKCGLGRVRFDPVQLEEIKKAITAFDIQRLIGKGAIYKIQALGVSRARARVADAQKRKGRRSGHGSRKGRFTARLNPKTQWVANVRAQRDLLKHLRHGKLIKKDVFRNLYAKIKGGFFRSTRHIKIYIKEQGLLQK